jgi:hypothetical protein
MARPYLGENADFAELNRYTLELANRDPTDPLWGTLGRGANFGAVGATNPADMEFTTLPDGTPIVRLGDAWEGFQRAGLPVFEAADVGKYTTDIPGYHQQQTLQKEKNAKEFDIGKMGVMGLGMAGLTAGLGGAFPGFDAVTGMSIPAGETGILSQLGVKNPFGNMFSGGTDGAVNMPDQVWGVNERAGDSGIFDELMGEGFDPSTFESGVPELDQFVRDLGPKIKNAITVDPATGKLMFSGGLTSAAGGAATSAIGKILSGKATADDYLKAAGAIAPGILGMIGANQQSNTLQGISDKYLAMGAPFRDRLEQTFQPGYSLMNEPGFKDALDVSSQGVLRNLSAKAGNPYENPGSVSEAQKYVTGSLALPQLNTMRSQLGTFGQLGTNMAGTADMAGANASGGALNAVGYGLSNLLNEGNDLDSLLKKLNLSNSGMKLNLGMGF